MMLAENNFVNLSYFLVTDADRGLTRQRNFGIRKASAASEIICFLDDDTVLEDDYFEKLLETYSSFPEAIGVGGYITNEVSWVRDDTEDHTAAKKFFFDGWSRKEGSRFVLRKKLRLDADRPPGFLPEYSHGRSISFLPPSGKTYQVEQLMGGVSSFRKEIFERFRFSTYFEGYGLYEDADFTLRLSKTGTLYVNTAARLAHYHEPAGRPNQYDYGMMVVRNGWYVWRVKYPKPSLSARAKWHLITLLLILVRFSNIFTTTSKHQALTESIGRLAGWCSLSWSKPRMQ